MCGIASIISSDPNTLDKVSAMVDVLDRRGPDSRGIKYLGNCAMGHTRLSLQDLDTTGDQPMTLGPLTLVYNGEIYNHRELRQRYLGDLAIESSGDTATLLHLIDKLGVADTLPLLRGMYAFAVWDERTQLLTCAVDPFAVKPLYIWHDGEEFACASSSAALLNLKPTWRIDARGMAKFFNLGGSDGAWKGIHRIDGGMMVTYYAALGSMRLQRWYRPTFNPDAADQLDTLITEALHQVQLADTPVGIFLSGGVDSSLAASSMAMGAPAFHLNSDEREHAAIVAQHFGLPLHVVDGDPSEIGAAYTDIALRTGEPTMGGHIPWMVSRVASDHCKAAISANGADEIFFGYDRTARIPSELPAQRAHILRDDAKYNLSCGAPDWRHFSIMDERFPWDAHSRWQELMLYIQHDLNPTLDAASMCWSLEMRVPYLDHLLVEAALSLPASFHGNKRVLRERLAELGIPDSTINRRKLGFSLSRQDANLKVHIQRAVKRMEREYGLKLKPGITGRDRAYVELCCLSWTKWMDAHQQTIATAQPA